VPPAPSSTRNKSASAIAAPMSVCPVNKAVLSLSAVTDVSEGVTVPPTAPDISTIKILAPLAGAVLKVICVPPVAKV